MYGLKPKMNGTFSYVQCFSNGKIDLNATDSLVWLKAQVPISKKFPFSFSSTWKQYNCFAKSSLFEQSEIWLKSRYFIQINVASIAHSIHEFPGNDRHRTISPERMDRKSVFSFLGPQVSRKLNQETICIHLNEYIRVRC